jgi:hypothetical protein
MGGHWGSKSLGSAEKTSDHCVGGFFVSKFPARGNSSKRTPLVIGFDSAQPTVSYTRNWLQGLRPLSGAEVRQTI